MIESRSADVSPIRQLSPITSGPIRRVPTPISQSRPTQTGGPTNVTSSSCGALADEQPLVELGAAALELQLALERVEGAGLQLVQRADVVPVLVDLVHVERDVVLEQRREDVLRPVRERAVGEVVEDLAG